MRQFEEALAVLSSSTRRSGVSSLIHGLAGGTPRVRIGRVATSIMFAVMTVMAAVACSGSDVAHPASVAGIHKIRHVIVIMQENRSFDSYFGTFPGANGIPMRDGKPTVCVPDPGSRTC